MKWAAFGTILIFGTWTILHASGIVSPLLLPSSLSTFKTMFILLFSGELNIDIKFTGYRWLVGYITGIISGVPIGLLMGSSKLSYKILEFPVEFFRSLPVTSLFPLFLLAFGIGDNSKIAMVWASVVFIIIINTAYGVSQAPQKRILMAKIFRASKWQIFKDIIFWEAITQIFVGMRLALSASFIVIIVSEMFIGTQFGLGQRIFDAYSKNAVVELYAILLFVGIAGYIVNILFVHFEKRTLFWVGK